MERKLEDKCVYWIKLKPKHKLFHHKDLSKCGDCNGYDERCEDYESRKQFYLSLEIKS